MTEQTPHYKVIQDPQTGIVIDAEELEKLKRATWAMVAEIGRIEGKRYKILETRV